MEDQKFLIDERFSTAFGASQVWTIMGRRLLPYSYWHKFLLEMLQSPILLGKEVTFGDLEVFSIVCTTRYPNTPLFPKTSGLFRQIAWVWRNRKRSVVEELKKVEAYLLEHTSRPKLWQNDKGKSAGSRDVDDGLEEVAYYRFNTKCSREEPWNLSIGEVAWMNVIMARLNGAEVHFWTPLDEAAFKRHKEAKRKERAGWARDVAELMPWIQEAAMRQALDTVYERMVKKSAESIRGVLAEMVGWRVISQECADALSRGHEKQAPFGLMWNQLKEDMKKQGAKIKEELAKG